MLYVLYCIQPLLSFSKVLESMAKLLGIELDTKKTDENEDTPKPGAKKRKAPNKKGKTDT